MGKFKNLRMLRHFKLLILLATVLFVNCQSSTTSFRTLTIGFQHGDEVMSYEELYFKKIGDNIIGSIAHPNTDKVLISDIKLDRYQKKKLSTLFYP